MKCKKSACNLEKYEQKNMSALIQKHDKIRIIILIVVTLCVQFRNLTNPPPDVHDKS